MGLSAAAGGSRTATRRASPRWASGWAGIARGCSGGAPTSSSWPPGTPGAARRSEEHTSELQSPCNLVCRLLLEKKKKTIQVLFNLRDTPIRCYLILVRRHLCGDG